MTTYKAGDYYTEWRHLERLTTLDRVVFDELLVHVYPPTQGLIVEAWRSHKFHVHGGYARLPIANKPVRKWDDYSGPRIEEEPPKPHLITVTISIEQYAAYVALARAVEEGMDPYVDPCTGMALYKIPNGQDNRAIAAAWLAVWDSK